MKNSVLSNLTRSHISSDRVRSGCEIKEKLNQVKGSVSGKTLRAVDLAPQNGASSWLLACELEI